MHDVDFAHPWNVDVRRGARRRETCEVQVPHDLARPKLGANGGETFASDSDRRRFLVLAVLCLTLLITNLDATILNVALPRS